VNPKVIDCPDPTRGTDTVAAVARVDWRESGLGFLQPPAGTTALARQLEYYRRAVLWAESLGRPIIDNQSVHFRLAELSTEVECLKSLVYRACEEFISGKDVTRLASMAKLKCGRLDREVADACLQYWGGMGYTWDNAVSRAWRDGRLVSIGGGADEVMLGIICKLEGTLPGRSS